MKHFLCHALQELTILHPSIHSVLKLPQKSGGSPFKQGQIMHGDKQL
jgi:hypothetical protein